MLSSAELSRLWDTHAAALLLMARGRCGRVAGTEAEDCVQEAFIRLATQDPVPNDPAAWLMRVVCNAAIDAIRMQHRRVHREAQASNARPAWLQPADGTTLDAPSSDEIQRALLLLDDVTRDIVVAHLWNDMTFRQIAEVFDISSATAHRKYEAGIAALRSVMKTRTESNAHER
ncbi:MAG: sigma-70 family RNA polymerase sigma factor [Planctomycetaceae bacterium]|nr:sigma-70 family RNA polymerase sigma factor [Planctomycetaceae bacterium]